MYTRNVSLIAAGVFCALFACQPVLRAQYETASRADNKLEVSEPNKKKSPGWLFHKPDKKTSAEQLAYADKLLEKGRQRAAMKQYNALVHQWHASPEAPTAQLAYARILFERAKYKDSFDEYQYLIDNFAGQFPYEEVLERQFQIANYLMTAKRMKFLFLPGFAIQEQALPLFEKIVKNAPGWSRSVEAQFSAGLINENMKDYQAAMLAYDKLRYNFPFSDKVADAAFRKACCLYQLANENLRDEAILRQALSGLASFLADYPKHDRLGVVREYRDKLDDRLSNMYYERGVFYDKTPGKKKAAILAYEDFLRNFPSSKLAGEVGQRIEILKKETGSNK